MRKLSVKKNLNWWRLLRRSLSLNATFNYKWCVKMAYLYSLTLSYLNKEPTTSANQTFMLALGYKWSGLRVTLGVVSVKNVECRCWMKYCSKLLHCLPKPLISNIKYVLLGIFPNLHHETGEQLLAFLFFCWETHLGNIHSIFTGLWEFSHHTDTRHASRLDPHSRVTRDSAMLVVSNA